MKKHSLSLILSLVLSLLFTFKSYGENIILSTDNESSKTDTNVETYTETENEPSADTEDVPIVLSSIAVTPPQKTDYCFGDTLNLEGMTVTAIYSDGSEKDVTNEASVNVTKLNSTGNINVTVTYLEKTSMFQIYVESAISFFFNSSTTFEETIKNIDGKTDIKVNDVLGIEFNCDILDINGNKVTNSYAEKNIYLCKGSPDTSNAVKFTASLTSSNLSEDFILIFPVENLDYDTKYYFRIEPNKFKNAQGDILGETEPADFTTCSKRSDIESNNSYYFAQEINVLTDTITGTLGASDEVDYYKFKVPCHWHYRQFDEFIESINISRSKAIKRQTINSIKMP